MCSGVICLCTFLSRSLRVSLRLRGWLGSGFSSWLSGRLSSRLSYLRLSNLLSRGLDGIDIWQTAREGVCRRNSLLSLSRSRVLNSLNRGRQVLLVLGNLRHNIRKSLQCLDVLWRVLVGCDVDLLNREASACGEEVRMISTIYALIGAKKKVSLPKGPA